jgi:predicted nucleic acid-binding protein
VAVADWQRQYWDSPLFLAYLTERDEARADMVEELLDRYDRGGIEIVISSFVIAEVRRLPTPGAATPADEREVPVQAISPDQVQRVRRMFESEQLELHVLTPRIAQRAADIGNEYPRLLPGDCVHIATAIEAGVDVLFTWDGGGQRRRPGDMLRYDGRINDLAIREPFVPLGPMFDPPPQAGAF